MASSYDDFHIKLNNVTGSGKVSRVVPGRLVYVETPSHQETFACKPNNLRFRKIDGSIKRYKGEPFSAIGLEAGATVTFSNNAGETMLIVEPKKESRGRFMKINRFWKR